MATFNSWCGNAHLTKKSMELPKEGGAPASEIAKQALEELGKEGHEIADTGADNSFDEHGNIIEKTVEEKKPETEKKAEEVKAPVEGEKKPEEGEDKKTVPAWELMKEKRQRETAEAKTQELEAKILELSKDTSKITKEQKEEIADDYKKLAEEHNVDPEFLVKLEKSFMKKLGIDPAAITKKIESIEARETAAFQEQEYAKEFDKDITPLVKAEFPGISDEALKEVKDKLHELAFSDVYEKVPLAKIFKAEKDGFKVHVPKKEKSAEGGGSGKAHTTAVIDFENMDEETFKNLPPEKVLEFNEYQKNKGNGPKWSR